MLSISTSIGGGGGQAEYYVKLTAEEYYTKGGEPPGRWWGRAGEVLGLTGRQVTQADLDSLINGFAPDSDQPLVQNAGSPTRQGAWDLTFSAPKSVSVLWALSDEGTRSAIQQAQQKAVERALEYIQKYAAFGRRGKGGTERVPVELLAATFEHSCSRSLDPQLHTHALVPNIGLRSDGTWGTIRSLDVFQHKMAAGAVYRMVLANELSQRLGVEIQADGKSFGIAGISKSLCDHFSKRRSAIEAALSENGVAGAVASKLATLATRKTKVVVQRAELFDSWKKEAAAFGIDPEKQVREIPRQRKPEPTVNEVIGLFTKVRDRILEHESVFVLRHIIRKVAEEAVRAMRGTSFEFAKLDLAIGAMTRDHNPFGVVKLTDGVFTTRGVIEVEERLIGTIRQGRGATNHVVPAPVVDTFLRRHDRESAKTGKSHPLNEEQKGALRHITTQAGTVSLIEGMAGTGKSTLLGAARQIWESRGFEVVGTCVAGKAAQGLHESSGIPSKTMASLFATWDKNPNARRFTPNTVVVVDEAGMVGTRDLERLIRESAGAKVVLVGDSLQLQPISAGSPFRSVGDEIGRAHLKDIRRQREGWARKMVTDFSEGRTSEAIDAAARHGWVHEASTKKDLQADLVQAWADAGGIAEPETNLILAGTREDVRVLNRAAQAARLANGDIGEAFVEHKGEILRVGDQIMFGKNSTTLGVMNGHTGRIESILDRKLIVLVGEKVEAKGRSKRRVIVDLSQYEHVSLGYAMTTHKAQGVTAENAFVLVTPENENRHMAYVQASRARGQTHFFLCAPNLDVAEGVEPRRTLAPEAMQTQRIKRNAAELRATAPAPSQQRDSPQQEISR